MACLHFYLILCTYYIIRPIRAEMAVANGVDNIQWLFLLTMLVLLAIAPIFGWITSRYRTRQFLSYITLFFAFNLVVFYFLFLDPQRPAWVTRAFCVWVNAFSMFIVSLFWSFMNDIFETKQARRLFAFIAAGGLSGQQSSPFILTARRGSRMTPNMPGLAPLSCPGAAFGRPSEEPQSGPDSRTRPEWTAIDRKLPWSLARPFGLVPTSLS